jgi:rhamnosyltransferase
MFNNMDYKISVVVPTYNGNSVWAACAKSINDQNIKLHIVKVIDSLSLDNTPQITKSYKFDMMSISASDFNHGGTRNLAAKKLSDSDILIFMTQDAILATPNALENMVALFYDLDVAAVCGRQLPHDDANPLAIHARLFNYPEKSCVKSASDISTLGIKTAFMSNSFAAYRTKVFFELGGFPENTILAEDMYLTAKMIKAGYKVAYCAEAAVKHSHNYTPLQEFQRYFDIGVFHACEPWIREEFGGAGGEGMRFIRSELAFLLQTAPLWIPRSLITSACKLLGYKLGQKYRKLPWSWCRSFSMYKSYWLQNKM